MKVAGGDHYRLPRLCRTDFDDAYARVLVVRVYDDLIEAVFLLFLARFRERVCGDESDAASVGRPFEALHGVGRVCDLFRFAAVNRDDVELRLAVAVRDESKAAGITRPSRLVIALR